MPRPAFSSLCAKRNAGRQRPWSRRSVARPFPRRRSASKGRKTAMARCTAPIRGHNSAAAAAACPACSSRYGRYRSSYGSSYSSSYSSGGGSSYSGVGRSSGGGSSRPRWSRAGSSVSYTPAQVASLTPVREAVEKEAAAKPDLRDSSYATLGMTVRQPPRNCTICWRRLVSRFGSARRT
jgi:hypothetical protein